MSYPQSECSLLFVCICPLFFLTCIIWLFVAFRFRMQLRPCPRCKLPLGIILRRGSARAVFFVRRIMAIHNADKAGIAFTIKMQQSTRKTRLQPVDKRWRTQAIKKNKILTMWVKATSWLNRISRFDRQVKFGCPATTTLPILVFAWKRCACEVSGRPSLSKIDAYGWRRNGTLDVIESIIGRLLNLKKLKHWEFWVV